LEIVGDNILEGNYEGMESGTGCNKGKAEAGKFLARVKQKMGFCLRKWSIFC